jgi:hypothetical protein
MKIEWEVNPFETRVLLDEQDRKYLRQNIRLEAALSAINYRDLRDRAKTPEDAEMYAKYIKGYDDTAFDEDDVSASIDKDVIMYEEELQSSHVGDCICFACSCMKCRAEGFLGIDTISGLGKHEGSKIDACFTDTSTRPWSRRERTAAEVIAELSKPISREKNEHWKNSTQEVWDACIPRWEQEQKRALVWYEKYAKEHGFI